MIRKLFKKMNREVSRRLENFLGEYEGYGTCPNCGNTLRKKNVETLYYIGSDGKAASILFCKECFDPCRLSRTKTIAWLKKHGWAPNKVEAVDKGMVGIFTC